MTEIVGRATNTVTLTEAARLLGMGVSTARRAERAGHFNFSAVVVNALREFFARQGEEKEQAA